jgi:hypothetical protein
MILNEELTFSDVRYLVSSKSGFSKHREKFTQVSPDFGKSFDGFPDKVKLDAGVILARLDFEVLAGIRGFFNSAWWLKEAAMRELLDANSQDFAMLRREWQHRSALPKASKGIRTQIVEIQLTAPAYAWVGQASAMFDKPGGIEQVYLPNLARGTSGQRSNFACLHHTYTIPAV